MGTIPSTVSSNKQWQNNHSFLSQGLVRAQSSGSNCFSNNFSNGPKVDNAIEGKEHSLEHCNGVSSFASEINGAKESGHAMRASRIPVKGTKSTSEQMQTLKIPEAVVAFAQATAKANGDPEKCWPLLSPLMVQMQKCDKCSREFCSPINHRQHIRVHRRSLNIDKDSPKNGELLGAFWDKLSLDEAMEIASLKNATLQRCESCNEGKSEGKTIWKSKSRPLILPF